MNFDWNVENETGENFKDSENVSLGSASEAEVEPNNTCWNEVCSQNCPVKLFEVQLWGFQVKYSYYFS